jgi:hypothetical protein
MEALLEKEGTVESWNEERLDELSRRMDAGFEKMATKEEMNLRFDAVDARLGRFEGGITAQLSDISNRLDRLSNGLLVGAFGVIAALIANMAFG